MTIDGDTAAGNLIVFVRSLRSNGFAVTPATTGNLVEAVRIVGMHRGADVREAFRAVVVTSRGQNAIFDDLFDRFFSGDVVIALDAVVERVVQRTPLHRVQRIGATGGTSGDDGDDRDDVLDVVGGSETEKLMDVDFSELSDDEAAAVAAILASMTWSPSSVRSRRWRPASNGSDRTSGV